MKNKKNEYQPDDRICIFYVADRIKMLEGIKSHKQLTQQQNLDELMKQTLLNILSAKGIIYTYYKNKKLTKRNNG